MFQKYLENVKYAKKVTSKRELAKFQAVVQYMRKYSDKYGLDYLLMGAQGYQESTLDPNKWFNNVELVAAEAIGRETVQYVSNIYKYYLAYKMLVEQREAREKAKKEAVPIK